MTDAEPTTDSTRDAEVPLAEDPRPNELRVAKSLVLVNTGDGKGKTTSALGVVLRAVAQDWRVAVIQFLKSGDWKVGEETAARRLGVEWWAIGEGFSWDSENLDKDQETARLAWAKAKEAITSGDYRLVMLDEITYPLNWGWIPMDDVVDTIVHRPERTSVILTGRDAPAPVIEIADTVTEMRMVKHAYNQGIAAKKGIDY
ncbi:MAG: cob(I)yrinic acid a,c-diamide adenosyltransferase [Ilumatobacteraceae bacterium]